MATLLLASVIKGANPYMGALLGFAASSIDNMLFTKSTNVTQSGQRLDSVQLQQSTYGGMIPIVVGKAKISGNIIWATGFTEHVTEETQTSGGGKGGGGRSSVTTRTYTYSISFAVALCEGVISGVGRIWADGKILPSTVTYRVYRGTETQMPDSYMEAHGGGAGSSPAYRGIAYVVFQDMQLENYGNRIPQLQFEVFSAATNNSLENKIKAVVLMPGSGEFVCDTKVQKYADSTAKTVNMHNDTKTTTDFILAVNNLKATLPNVEYVSFVYPWYSSGGTDLAAQTLKPKVEQHNVVTSPTAWTVAGISRNSAEVVPYVDGKPVFGGTPADSAVIRALQYLKSKGYKILFYPFMQIDSEGYPWRGEITGDAKDVQDFFRKADWGYNEFIQHCASLCVSAGGVEAFAIGTEMVGLNRIYNSATDSYPAVAEWINLAGIIRTTLGSSTKLLYAADWSEYNFYNRSSGNIDYPLDELFANSNINYIGVDNYIPISDYTSTTYDLDGLVDGFESGELWDYYYASYEDRVARIQTPLTEAKWRLKDIRSWWEQYHYRVIGGVQSETPTAWIPESKKIWFTECGFPSIDKATNQPNVFYDYRTPETGLPYFSTGKCDDSIQRLGLEAFHQYWQQQTDMVLDRSCVWCWDMRPYPNFPAMTDIWSDGQNYRTGHWINGKVGNGTLRGVIQRICEAAKITAITSLNQLDMIVDGFIATNQSSARELINTLQGVYFFDAFEIDGILKFASKSLKTVCEIPDSDLGVTADGQEADLLKTSSVDIRELPAQINLTYYSYEKTYEVDTVYSRRIFYANSSKEQTITVPIVMSKKIAQQMVDILLAAVWSKKETYQFTLGSKWSALAPADVVLIKGKYIDVTKVDYDAGMVMGEGVSIVLDLYDIDHERSDPEEVETVDANGLPEMYLLNLPMLASDDIEPRNSAGFYAAASGYNYTTISLLKSSDGGATYGLADQFPSYVTVGSVATALGAGNTDFWDNANQITVVINHGTLESRSDADVLNGYNAALLGSEIIQFKNATLTAENTYLLSGLLRGRKGTEWAVGIHGNNETFILLELSKVKAQEISLYNLNRLIPYRYGSATESDADDDLYTNIDFAATGSGYKPYSVCNVVGSRDGSDNLTISWVRRARYGGEWRDYVDIPLHETFERYEVDILDGSTVVRTIFTDTPTATYAAEQQATDFGSVQPTLTVRIYQISETIGRGYVKEDTI